MKFLTFLNNGCVEICKNMLKSAENVGLNIEDFIIACIDEEAYEQMKSYPGAYLALKQDIKDYKNWSFDETSEFRKIVKFKWKIIKDNYEKHKELCFVDTDIVFVKNPLPHISNQDVVLFQCDVPGSTICSGFMVFNDTEVCKKLIEKYKMEIISKDSIETIQFATTCKTIILSSGTYSWMIGILSFFSTIYYPKIKKIWHGNIFVFPDWNEIKW